MYNLRNRRKTYLTASVPRRKRTKNLRKPTIIPSDVLMEIFKEFPAKDLMQFRCVSKTWNLVIRDPVFANLHYRISKNRPSATATILMGCNRPGRKLYFYKIDPQRRAFHQLTIDNEFLNSASTFVTEIVNGLVCLCRLSNIMVCNITTHEIISLPPQPLNCLDLYPVYSLGYDPLYNEYKVLCIWYRSGFCKCAVLTIGKNSGWREVLHPLHFDLVPKGFHSVMYSDIVYHDGALHWLTQYYHGQKQKLVSFNVRKENFLVTDFPAALVLGVRPKLVRIGSQLVVLSGDSNMVILEDYQNQVWVERNIQVSSLIFPIGSIANRLICRNFSDRTYYEFDPNNGTYLRFVVSGEGQDVVERSIGSLLYPAKYYICETVENIYPLRQS